MEIIKIDSKKNKNLTFLRRIKGDNKFLKENNLFIIDDYLTFLEFLKNDKLTNISYKVLKIFTYDYKIVDFIGNWVKDYKKNFNKLDLRVYLANKEVLRDIFKLDNLKVAALISYELKKNIIDLNDIKSDKLNYVIVLDGIENPGNLGSIFRNSLAFGFNNLVLVNLKTSPFNSLSLRANEKSL
jgi:RNA methyltransferase, TrmH family